MIPRCEAFRCPVAVFAWNEEPNIRRCLASLAWAEQVIVVDSGSTDNTAVIADLLGAHVVEQPWQGFASPAPDSAAASSVAA